MTQPFIVALEGIDGSGKTTTAQGLCSLLSAAGHRALYCRLSREMGLSLEKLVDIPTHSQSRYQDIVPSEFRAAIYIIDAALQFRHLKNDYERYDVLIFDRWLQTYDVYCDAPRQYEDWFAQIRSKIPVPDILFYLKCQPSNALIRLQQRSDWTAKSWGADILLAELESLSERYTKVLAGSAVIEIDSSSPQDETIQALFAAITGLLFTGNTRAIITKEGK